MVGIIDFDIPSCCSECQMASCKGLSGQFYCDITTYDVDMDDTKRDVDCPLVEAIPKDQYEARLKDDMVVMLEVLKQDIIAEAYGIETDCSDYVVNVADIDKIIQQKINNLKGNK